MNHIMFLVGESGCGKSYLQNALIDLYPSKYCQIISTTSRAPRMNEKDGEQYHFIDQMDFEAGIIDGKFLQHVNFGGNFYGTTLAEYEQNQKIGIFVCTPEGVMDTVNALKENDKFDFTYSVVYFLVTDQLLRDHDTPQERIDRGNIREKFNTMYSRNVFEGIPIRIILDKEVEDLLYTSIDAMFQ